MPSVWMLDTGDYSDYHVVAICSTEKKAWELHTALGMNSRLDGINQGLKIYEVAMEWDGTTTHCEEQVIDTYNAGRTNGWPDEYAPYRFPVTVYVWAKDEQHAVKIVNEKRTQAIALNSMVT
jgi:hypothetical protein